MIEDDKLRQQLWDYAYGLLEPPEASALEQRITSEHDVARAYSEVRQQADQLGAAARLELPAIELRPPTATTCTKHAAGVSRQSGLPWVTALALTVLVALAGGIAWRRAWLNDPRTIAAIENTLAAEQVRLVVALPPTLTSEQANLVTVQASDLLNQPRSGEVFYELLNADGATVSEDRVTTAADGTADLLLTADDLAEADEMRLAWGKEMSYEANAGRWLSVPLPTPTLQFRTQLTTNQVTYVPDEVAQFRSVTLAASTPRDVREFNVDFGLVAAENPTTPLWQTSQLTRYGVGAGEIPVSHDGQGLYRLFARSATQEFPEQVRALVAGSSATYENSNTMPDELAMRDFDGIVPQLQVARQPLVAEPVLAQREFIELQVAPGGEDRQWLASVTCRGQVIGQQPLNNLPEESQQRVALAPEGDGLLALAIHDYAEQPPVALAQQWLYRAPTEFWRVSAAAQEVADASNGKANTWAFTVQDEQQRPGVVTLGVRVVADSNQPLPSLAESYYLAPLAYTASNFAAFDLTIPNAQSAEQLQQYLATLPTHEVTAQSLPVVHDNTTQAEQRFAESLRAWQLLRQRETSATTRLLQWGSAALLLLLVVLWCLRCAGTLWQWGPRLAIAGLLLIAAMKWQEPTMLHQPGLAMQCWPAVRELELAQVAIEEPVAELEEMTKARYFSDLVDLSKSLKEAEENIQLLPQKDSPARHQAYLALGIDFGTMQPEAPINLYAKFLPNIASKAPSTPMLFFDSLRLPEEKLVRGLDALFGNSRFDSFHWHDYAQQPLREAFTIRHTLYWNPHLQTDEQGRAEIRFTVPDNGQDYVLQVDAHGHGRLGALRLPLPRTNNAN